MKRIFRMVLVTIFALSLMAALFTGLGCYVIWTEHPESPLFKQIALAFGVSLAIAASTFALERRLAGPGKKEPKKVDIDFAKRFFSGDTLVQHQVRIGQIRNIRICCSVVLAMGVIAQLLNSIHHT